MIIFSGIAADIENRCESTVLDYACDWFVPPDQLKHILKSSFPF